MVEPHVGAVGVRCVNVHHRRVGPTGRPFGRDDASDGLTTSHKQVHLEGPRARGNHPFVGEIIDLDIGIMPVTANQLPLALQQFDRSIKLCLGQGIGVINAQVGLVGFEIECGVGNVNRSIKGLNPPFIRFPVGQGHLFEDHIPTSGSRIAKSFGVVHQHIRAPLVGDTIMFAIHCVPRGSLQALVNRAIVGDQVDVEFLDLAAEDQA